MSWTLRRSRRTRTDSDLTGEFNSLGAAEQLDILLSNISVLRERIQIYRSKAQET